mmetsp:Transcript_14075/g.38500  ORF Transcript_14075/g.38500 Transcript_14075/m.38500 type:complete len:715 (-) Transcript_14075:190-2334(-)|eukprot:CAMPEP_0117480960 /NCGR_PEP_ID=MMETSP0784-20121206/12658_1 /TAXON_ID=39447 /ORGANISM="" /LENGTH=714 /DNA_ID=CAMNT_0005275411 /DNA_START=24 /DNA_END=2168 /DNA_ORIENTATION=-
MSDVCGAWQHPRPTELLRECECLREQLQEKDAAIDFLKTKIATLQNRAGVHAQLAATEPELQQQLHERDLELEALHEELKLAREQASAEVAELRQRLLMRDEQVHVLGAAIEGLQQKCYWAAGGAGGEEDLNQVIEHNHRLSSMLQEESAKKRELQQRLLQERAEMAKLQMELKATCDAPHQLPPSAHEGAKQARGDPAVDKVDNDLMQPPLPPVTPPPSAPTKSPCSGDEHNAKPEESFVEESSVVGLQERHDTVLQLQENIHKQIARHRNSICSDSETPQTVPLPQPPDQPLAPPEVTMERPNMEEPENTPVTSDLLPGQLGNAENSLELIPAKASPTGIAEGEKMCSGGALVSVSCFEQEDSFARQARQRRVVRQMEQRRRQNFQRNSPGEIRIEDGAEVTRQPANQHVVASAVQRSQYPGVARGDEGSEGPRQAITQHSATGSAQRAQSHPRGSCHSSAGARRCAGDGVANLAAAACTPSVAREARAATPPQCHAPPHVARSVSPFTAAANGGSNSPLRPQSLPRQSSPPRQFSPCRQAPPITALPLTLSSASPTQRDIREPASARAVVSARNGAPRSGIARTQPVSSYRRQQPANGCVTPTQRGPAGGQRSNRTAAAAAPTNEQDSANANIAVADKRQPSPLDLADTSQNRPPSASPVAAVGDAGPRSLHDRFSSLRNEMKRQRGPLAAGRQALHDLSQHQSFSRLQAR